MQDANPNPNPTLIIDPIQVMLGYVFSWFQFYVLKFEELVFKLIPNSYQGVMSNIYIIPKMQGSIHIAKHVYSIYRVKNVLRRLYLFCKVVCQIYTLPKGACICKHSIYFLFKNEKIRKWKMKMTCICCNIQYNRPIYLLFSLDPLPQGCSLGELHTQVLPGEKYIDIAGNNGFFNKESLGQISQ